jgi:hypothetical protein
VANLPQDQLPVKWPASMEYKTPFKRIRPASFLNAFQRVFHLRRRFQSAAWLAAFPASVYNHQGRHVPNAYDRGENVPSRGKEADR